MANEKSEKVVMFGNPDVVNSILKEFKQNMDAHQNKEPLEKLSKFDAALDMIGQLGEHLEKCGIDADKSLKELIECVQEKIDEVKPEEDKKEEKKEASWEESVTKTATNIINKLRKRK